MKDLLKDFLCTHSNGKKYNFYKFANLDLFGNTIYSGQTSIENAVEEQSEMEKLLMSLKKYNPSNDHKINARKEVLKNAEDLFETRNKIINAFRDGTLPLAKNEQKEQTKETKTDWMHRPISELKYLKDSLDTYSTLSTTVGDKEIGIDITKIFFNGLLSGRINKDNVKNKYLEGIYDAKKLLDEAIVKKNTKARSKLKYFFERLEYTVFGPIDTNK